MRSRPNPLRSARLPLLTAWVLVFTFPLHAQERWRDPSPHNTQFISVDRDVRLEVLDWGGRGRPIVLLGCYLTAHAYDEFAPKLANQFRVYGITRRGLGASDTPPTGYTVQRSADDVLEVLRSLKLEKPVLIGTSCGGEILTTFGAQHSDRLGGLVYLNGAEDPTLNASDYDAPQVDPARLPPSIKPAPAPDYSSFEAYRVAQRRDQGVAFPEAELRQLFVAKADGSMGRSLLSPVVRKAITEDDRLRPEWGRVHAPVLAMFSTAPPFAEVERDSPPRNELERVALSQQYEAKHAMISRWKRDLLAGVPAARIVDLPGANLFMFLSNEADVLRELRQFLSGLRP
jgi:pimeloyl-ACP methyl ester carboxylesterase